MRQSEGTSRRGFLRGFGVAAGTLVLAGCDELSQQPWVQKTLARAERLTLGSQRSLLRNDDLAPEYTEADLSPQFRANGSTAPDDPAYVEASANGFADWRLKVGGLVEKPMDFTLADLRAMPARTQITRHDCVEGWSCIGKWTGTPLKTVLDKVGVKPEAKYIMFRCADTLEQTLDGSGRYYESIGLPDAVHPQTILAYEMNGETLPIPYGAPLRLRVERQLGYKMAKYIMSIDAVASLDGVGSGKGGFWEDRGYEWYAGI